MHADASQAQAWAEWVGLHMGPVFLVLWAALLLLASAAFVGLKHGGSVAARSPWPRPLWLSLFLAIGACALLAAAGVFAGMAEAMESGKAIGLFDVRLSETLARELSPATLRSVALATHLGDPITLTLLVVAVSVLLLVRRHTRLAFGWALACTGGAVFHRTLKQIFARVRPVHEHGFAVADGYSFPSGHTTGSVVVYGMLAYLYVRQLPPRWHLPAVLAAASLAFGMGFSRVMLQVHWASDVIAGFASGLAWLTVCIAAMEYPRWRARA
ncbi:phosphatase PAP2 family protein [Hydrogenophaga palleronii]|uniref:phosphatase PAP2 family protein n=1 Tax=Hydrogenophaga palleronii TaxID=65655 RepID=UPI000826A62D|nr:phosphatase PAP2 family protein [Hydrogenophaga palleronii]